MIHGGVADQGSFYLVSGSEKMVEICSSSDRHQHLQKNKI
jgi:hypothetical protein